MNLGLSFELQWRDCVINIKHIPKKTISNEFQAPWLHTDCEKITREKEKWRAKANSERGTEEDHQKFRKLRKYFKKIMKEKMRLNVEDESDTSLISKKFWKYVNVKLYGIKTNFVVNQLTKETYLTNSFSISFR